MGRKRKSAKKGLSNDSLARTNILKIIKRIHNPTMIILKSLRASDLISLKYSFAALWTTPFIKEKLHQQLFPEKYSSLYKNNITSDIELQKLVLYESCVFIKFSEQINSFLDEKETFEAELLYNHDKANQSLNNIEKKYGKSLWLLENKINCLSQESISEQKDFSNKILQDDSCVDITKLYIRYFSMRAEDKISVAKYRSNLQNLFGSLNKETEDIVSAKLDLYGGDTIESLSEIISHELSSSLIDRYLTFRIIIKMILSKDDKVLSKVFLSEVIQKLESHITDTVLVNCNNCLRVEGFTFNKESKLSRSLDLYTKGKYIECVKSCEDDIFKNRLVFDLSEVYVKSIIHINGDKYFTNEDNAQAYIFKKMESVLRRKEDAFDSAIDLIKIAYKYSSCEWSNIAFSFVLRYTNLYSQEDIYVFYKRYNSLSLQNENPLSLLLNDACEHKLNFKHDLAANTLLLFSAIAKKSINELDNLKGIEKERKEFYRGIIFHEENNFDKSVEIFDGLYSEAPNEQCKFESLKYLLLGLLKLNKIEKAAKLLIVEYLCNRGLITSMPIRNIVDAVCHDIDEVKSSSIAYPIVLDIYVDHISDSKINHRALAFEDFLDSVGVTKPTELKNIKSDLDVKLLVYFLRNVCKQSVIDTTAQYYLSSKDIVTERIQICQLLKIYDKENEKIYEQEITELTKQLFIDRLIEDIEKSKITIDIDGIKRSCEKDVKENFYRFKELSKVYRLEYLEDLIMELTSSIGDRNLKFVLPGNEADSLVGEMILDIRNKFISSNEYGLNGTLSANIRHGTLVGQLRNSLVSKNLITQQSGDDDEYSENEFWLDKFNDLTDDKRLALSIILLEFSRQIDDLIDLAKNKWIQIKTEKNNIDGLLDFRIKLNELYPLKKKLRQAENEENFIDLVIEFLWSITDKGLDELREKFELDFKSKINEIFGIAIESVSQLDSNAYFSELKNTFMLAKTDVIYDVDRVASWFHRSDRYATANFTIMDSIEISKQMIASINPNESFCFGTNVTVNNEVLGKYLHPFVNIFYMLFDNIIKYSDIKEYNEDNVSVFVTDDEYVIYIKVSNVISDAKIAQEELRKVKNYLESKNYMDKIGIEGGSGLPKIKKILEIDLKGINFISVNLDNNKFVVEITLDKKGVLEL